MFLAQAAHAQGPWNIGAETNAGGAASVTATLTDGVLTISGAGAMMDFNPKIGNGNPPWNGYKSSITNLVIESGVTTIGEYMLSSGEYSHYNCHEVLTSVTIPNSVTTIGNYAFRNCTGLTSVTIPNSVTTIGLSAFNGCTGLTSVTIGSGVTTIGNYAFANCTGLTSVTIPNSVTTIGEFAFGRCTGLTSVTIGSGVTTIGKRAFANCTGLTSVTIPNSVTTIKEGAFDGCTGLTSVTIGSGVTTIDAFGGCTGLTEINVAAENANYSSENGVLFNKDKTTLIMYPQSKQGAYTIPNSVTTIGDGAFNGCTKLTSITMGSSVTTIGEAFTNCTGLTSITIGSGVMYIDDYAFSGCTGLTAINVAAENANYSSDNGVLFNKDKTTLKLCPRGKQGAYTIPDGVTTIEYQAFINRTKLTSVTIPNSVTTIGEWAFSGCTGLTSITIPNSVTTIERGTFENCTGLTSVTIPNSVTTIGYAAFSGCTGLTSVTIPNSVTTIGEWAFESTGLTSVTIGSGVTYIGEWAFVFCPNLTSVINLSAVPQTTSDNPVIGGVFTSATFANAKLYVLASSVSDYSSADIWKNFTNIIGITVPAGLTASYGQTLADVALPSAEWSWNNPAASVGAHGTQTHLAKWAPNGTVIGSISVSVDVAKAKVAEPKVATNLVYTGVAQSGIAANAAYTITNGSETNAGSYTATVALNDKANREWADGTTADLELAWTIAKAKITKPTVTTASLVYTGAAQSAGIAANTAYTIANGSATNAGSYAATVALNDKANREWADGTDADLELAWTIGKATPAYTVPTNLTATVGQTLANVTLPAGWAWVDAATPVGAAGTQKHKANYTPSDVANYNALADIEVTITVSAAVPIFANRENPIIGIIGVQTIGNSILLSNIPANAKVEVYSLQGKQIYSAYPENPKILKIGVQTKGMYIVKAGSQSVRVVVK